MPTTEIVAPPVQMIQQVPQFLPPLQPLRQTVTHEVGPLESMWRISKMYDVPINTILSANGLINPSQLKTGQKLTIPNAAPIRTFIPLYPNPRWRYIVVHHTASDIGNARLVNVWHNSRGFWNGLGYHFLIDNGTVGKTDGQIEIAPRWIRQEKGAHCKAGNMNDMSIGISLVGNFSKTQPSPEQMKSLVALLKQLMSFYRIPSSNVIRHGDAPGAQTECPGNRFPWNEVKSQI